MLRNFLSNYTPYSFVMQPCSNLFMFGSCKQTLIMFPQLFKFNFHSLLSHFGGEIDNFITRTVLFVGIPDFCPQPVFRGDIYLPKSIIPQNLNRIPKVCIRQFPRVSFRYGCCQRIHWLSFWCICRDNLEFASRAALSLPDSELTLGACSGSGMEEVSWTCSEFSTTSLNPGTSSPKSK